jgi:4-cresol dehydrogenase (hydroxylating)
MDQTIPREDRAPDRRYWRAETNPGRRSGDRAAGTLPEDSREGFPTRASDPEALNDFLGDCRDALGLDRVHHNAPGNTGALPRTVPAVVEVASVEEVQRVVRLANRHRVPLFPVSTGKNWGFGSAQPARGETVVLSLSRMNRIREINAEFGYAVVEPGVTQGDLVDALCRRNLPWVLDVTGAGRDTSVLGNAVERGIAYHTQRTETTRRFEVVLPDATRIVTGFQDPRARVLNNLYAHGVGPDPSGLFRQSRFGVVTAVTIDLRPLPQNHVSVGLNVNDAALPRLIETLRDLRRQGALEGIPHIANRARFASTMVPLMVRRSRNPLTKNRAESMLRSVFPQEWTLLTSLQGPSPLVRAKTVLLKSALRPLGRVLVMTPVLRFLQKIAGCFWPALRAVMDATASVQKLPLGTPSNDPLLFLDHDLPTGVSLTTDPDDHCRGFIYLTPVMPQNAATVKRFLDSLPDLEAAVGCPPAVTLNPLDGRVLEAVVSVTFDKGNPDAVRRVIAAGAAWIERLKEIGAYPYRVHIDHTAQTGLHQAPWSTLLDRIGNALDSRRVLAPGRYDGSNAARD